MTGGPLLDDTLPYEEMGGVGEEASFDLSFLLEVPHLPLLHLAPSWS